MKNKTLLDYKKSLGDWHYNPMIKSTDYQYVGRFVTDFSQHIRDVEWGEPETAKIYGKRIKINQWMFTI